MTTLETPVAVMRRDRSPVMVVGGPVPRLLAGDLSRRASLATHRAAYPTPPGLGADAWGHIGAIAEAAGLTGRGGAGFPTAIKLRSVAERRSGTVVVNGTEGEPSSHKDWALMTLRPHLVLDGALLAAAAAGADQVIICVSRDETDALSAIASAIRERETACEPVSGVAVVATPPRYVAGEETALVRWLNGGPAKPTSGARRPFERGVAGRPTLVQNVETLAHLALIVRHGPAWYRGSGSPDEPGTRLVTVALPGAGAVVTEIAVGTPVDEILATVGVKGSLSAVLVGGLFGTWISAADIAGARFSREGLALLGASPGAGILMPLRAGGCGIAETARVLSWYAGESTGQCGPCQLGLPALAETMHDLAAGRGGRRGVALLERYGRNIEGRGACRHPDGAVRLMRSALSVFGDDVARHASSRSCRASSGPPELAVPRPLEGWR